MKPSNKPTNFVQLDKTDVYKPKFGKDFWHGKVSSLVESVSQPKAVDGYLKELRLLCFEYESTRISSDDFDKLFEQTYNSSIERARREGAREAYKLVLETIKDSKNKFPGKKELEIIVDTREIEKSLLHLQSKLDHVRDTAKMMDEAYLSVTNDLPNMGDE